MGSHELEWTDQYLQGVFQATGIESRHVTDGDERPIDLGLSLATSDGRIQRGDCVLVSTVAAALSIVAALFTY